MWEVIIGLLPVLIQIVGAFVKNSSLEDQQKKKFFEWVKDVGDNLKSVKLHNYARVQILELRSRPFKETK